MYLCLTVVFGFVLLLTCKCHKLSDNFDRTIYEIVMPLIEKNPPSEVDAVRRTGQIQSLEVWD